MHQVVDRPAGRGPAGHALHQDPRRGPRRRPQAVPAEGHRPRPAGLDPGAAVRRRRHRRTAPRRATTRQRTPKKMKAAALRGALSDRARAGLVHVVSALVDGRRPVHQGGAHRAGRDRRCRAAPRAGRAGARRRGQLAVAAQPAERAPDRAGPAQHLRRAGQRRRGVHPGRAGRVPGRPDRGAHPGVAERAEARRREQAGGADQGARGEDQREPAAEEAPFGAGQPRSRWRTASQPDGFPIKGNADSMLYHVPGSRSTTAPRPRSGSPTPRPPSRPASSCRRRSGRRRGGGQVIPDPRDILLAPVISREELRAARGAPVHLRRRGRTRTRPRSRSPWRRCSGSRCSA